MNKIKKETFFWVFAGLAGLIIFVLYFNYAFPIASIDIRLSKDEIVKRAEGYIREQGFSLKGYQRSILFDSDYSASIYLQKTQGIKKSNELIAGGLPVWFWGLRWFKELEKQGFYCDVDPATGKIVNFKYSVLDDAEGASLTEKEAMAIAQAKVKEQGLDIKEYELKENNLKKQKNRTDYHFVWQKKDYSIGEAHLRVAVSIYGDKLGFFGRYLDIPEEFSRDLKKSLSVGQVLSMITAIFMFLLFIAAIVVLIIQFKKDRMNWKFGLFFGLAVCVLSAVDFLNSLPLIWSSYPDTISKSVYIAIAAGSMVMGALLIGLVIFLFGSCGESLAKETFKLNMPVFEALKKKRTSWADVFPKFIIGYALAFVFLGYITLFYLFGTKFFNIWMPPEAEYSNILSTSLPFLFPLSVAASAAISEEFMFRLFAVSFFKKYLRLTWLAVIIPAFIWAFAHSNYPVFPAYVRGIELTVAGIVFGIAFLKYGLETVLVTHFVIDAALVGLPLIKSHNAYFMISGIAVVAIAFLPVPVLMFFTRRQKRCA